MKTKVVLIILLLHTLSVRSQKAPIKFGDVSMEELKVTRYDKDSTASGFVIADYGEAVLEYKQGIGFQIRFDRIRRIKILKKDAYSFAEFDILLYHNNDQLEKLTSLKAVTYNIEGGKKVGTAMKSEGRFNEKVNDYWNRVRFTLPNVKEGSVIEISYTTLSEYIFHFQDWEFQSTIPTQWSEFRARIPDFFVYRKVMQGYVQPSIVESKQASDAIQITTREETMHGAAVQTTFDSDQIPYMRNDQRWVAQNVPAFNEEPRMNNTVDYISKISFELISQRIPGRAPKEFMSTWEELNQGYLLNQYFGAAINTAGFLTSITDNLIAGVSDPKEKIARIFSYVKANVEWNNSYRMYVTEDIKKAANDKKGSSADINLMLVAMLQRAGIAADPVLISTRNHGFIRKQSPASNQFNYVIASATLADKILLMDATDKTLPINVLPERCLNGEGLIISEKNSHWIPISPNFKSRTIASFDLSLNESGEMTGTFSVTRDGYDAQKMRESYNKKGEEGYVSELASSRQWDLQKSKFDNIKESNESVKESHEVKISQHAQQAGDVIYLSPFITDKVNENPFRSETRVYPVDFGSPSEHIIMGKFVVPPGYVVEELPAPKIYMLPKAGAKYVYSLSQVADKIQFTSHLSINQSIFTTEEYANLRDFYNQVLAKQNEQIVLKKK